MNNDDDDDDTGDDDGDFGDDIVGLFYDNEILYNKTRTVSSRVLNILLGLSGGQ